MLKACVIGFAILGATSPSHAFLDFIGETAKDAAEAAAVTGALTELIDEVAPDSAPSEVNAEVQAANEALQNEVAEARYITRETKDLLNGPDLTSKRLSQNIKFTTQFIKRTKRLLTKIGVLSPAVTTAVNTAETNTQLNEQLQNQQTMIQLQQSQFNYMKKKDLQQEKSWNEFIVRQKAIRNGNVEK